MRNNIINSCLTIFLFISLCFVNTIYAQNNIEVREVTATGETRELAVINGLIEALQQIKGIQLSAIKELKSNFSESMSSTGTNEQNSSSFNSENQKDILTKTKGYIKSYEVLNAEKKQEGISWEVTLSVSIPVYKTPGNSPNTRRKLAVIPFHCSKNNFLFGTKNISGKKLSRQFTQKVVSEITQTRKFSVLDREYIDEYVKEKKIILSGNTPASEQIKLGEVLGVDYLIVGNITDASLEKHPYHIELTGESGYKYFGIFNIDYRIIVMATRQIKWSDSISVDVIDDELSHLVTIENMQQFLIRKSAKAMINSLMNNIYPIRVVNVSIDGEIVLNQGGSSVIAGNVFEVFRPGKVDYDPYTHESLGASEEYIADIIITRVIPKKSYATLTTNQKIKISKGDICRRKKVVTYYEPEKKSKSKIIKLPFD